jgi:hypothetical protein
MHPPMTTFLVFRITGDNDDMMNDVDMIYMCVYMMMTMMMIRVVETYLNRYMYSN